VLSTAWSGALGLRVPIVNAPMGGVAGGVLASAVSAAGGLGLIGIGSVGSTVALEREASHPRRDGQRFGIGLVGWRLADEPQLLDAAMAARPSLITVSFGTDWSWVERVHAAGIHTATQIYDVEQARRAEAAGVDVLIARGSEGGGHGAAKVATLPLLASVLDHVSVPVLAAGGICSPRGLAAVLVAGASGAWVGTAFAACPESLSSDQSRQALLSATDTDTVLTRAFDVGLGYRWSAEFDQRTLRNDFSTQWSGRETELAHDAAARSRLASAVTANDHRLAPVDAGQGVGLVTEVRPVADIINELAAGAAELIAQWVGNNTPPDQPD
jgi:nitronate monooxygenase